MTRRLVVAALALAAVVAAMYGLGRREKDELRDARMDSRLVEFDDRRVAAFTVESPEEATRFERLDEGWRITAPRSDPASDVAIDALFSALRRAIVLRTLPDEGALEQYGLQPPRHRLRFDGAEIPVVEVGDVDPTGVGVFVRVASRPGVLLAKLPEALPLAQLAVARLRDKRLLGVARSRVGAIVVSRDGGEVRLQRRETGWWISAPRPFPASDAAVERLLEILAAAEADAIDDTADPRLAAGGSGATVVDLSAGNSVHRLILGAVGADGAAWAVRGDRGAPMRFSEAKFDRVPSSFDQLRETRLTKLNRYAVTRIAWRAPEGELAAAREGETTWKSPSGELLRGASVVEFLSAAVDARVEDWREGAVAGSPEAVLDLEAEGGAKERVEFFPNRAARVASVPGVIFRLAGDRPVYRP